jgi:YD repeat-containing protein
MRRYLKDAGGRTIGWRENYGDRTRGYDASGRIVGQYDETGDRTYDYAGRLVGQGDHLSSLIDDDCHRRR